MKWLSAILLSSLLFIASGCAHAPKADAERADLSFFAMDTYISMTAYGKGGQDALQKAETFISQAERRLSTTDPDSEIYRINHRENPSSPVSPDTEKLLQFSLSMADKTDGVLNPAMYPITLAWGFTTDHNQIPSEDTISQLLPRTNYKEISIKDHQVTLAPGMEIDLGATAKGYTGQEAADLLKKEGIQSAILNLGGNVQTIGAKPDGSPWRVGLQSPWGHEYLGILTVKDMAIVTSGSYQRFFKGEDGRIYHHIMDPATGRPAESGLVSATIITKDGGLADALSTALFIKGKDKSIQYWRDHPDFDMILITDDRTLYITKSIADHFTLDDAFKDLKVNIIS